MSRLNFPESSVGGTVARIGAVLLVLMAAGCGNDDFSDLDAFIQTERAKPRGPIEPLPEIKMIEPFIFKPEGLRDPFAPLQQSEQAEGENIGESSGIKPDTTRPKEELEAFSLDSLRMVGTVRMKGGLWGLVKANDGTIYRVQVGNYMGKNYGKIIRIVSDRIEVMEMISDKPGKWREQQQSLALTE
ncbi:MAG: pilus assembly protein PilP [Gammaproteobacteria bacterium]